MANLQEMAQRAGVQPAQTKRVIKKDGANLEEIARRAGVERLNAGVNAAKSEAKKGKGFLERFGDFSENTFGKLANALFGKTAEVVGKGLIGATESAAEIIEGAEIPVEEKRGFSVQPGGETPTAGDIAVTALELVPELKPIANAVKGTKFGAKLVNVMESSLTKIPSGQKEKAIKLYTEALNPTTKKNKAIAEKVVPGLLERGTVGRLQKIEEIAGNSMTEFGQAIDEAFTLLPEGTTVKVKPIVDNITQWQQKFIVNGTPINKNAVRLGDELKQVFVEFGEEVDVDSMRKIRQILDKEVSMAGGFTSDVITKLDAQVKKEATNAIRSEIAKDFPQIDVLNKEFSFWSNVDDVVGATLERTKSQSGKLRSRIGQGIGATVGASLGPEGAVAGAALGGKLTQAFNSAAWKTRDAVFRNNFADALVNADYEKIALFLKELGVATDEELTPIFDALKENQTQQ